MFDHFWKFHGKHLQALMQITLINKTHLTIYFVSFHMVSLKYLKQIPFLQPTKLRFQAPPPPPGWLGQGVEVVVADVGHRRDALPGLQGALVAPGRLRQAAAPVGWRNGGGCLVGSLKKALKYVEMIHWNG